MGSPWMREGSSGTVVRALECERRRQNVPLRGGMATYLMTSRVPWLEVQGQRYGCRRFRVQEEVR